MEHVERVLAVLRHKEPDRIPIDMGSPINSIHVVAYRNLLRYLGLGDAPLVIWDRMQQLAEAPSVHEAILDMFDVDFRHIRLNPPKLEEVKFISDDMYVNEFGITFKKTGYYYDMVEHLKPLYNAKNINDIEKYEGPKPHEGRFKGLAEIAKAYCERGFAVTADAFSGGIYELALWLRGLANFFRDLKANPEMAEALLDKTLEIHKEFWEAYLNEVGDHVHIVLYGDDYGLQTGLQMSPKTWREFIKPRLRDLVSFVKKQAHVHFMLHSCGSIRAIMDDLVEIGIDIINPLQPRAKGMDRRELGWIYGGKIVFHGNVDIQYVLPRGTVEEVEEEVKDVISTLAPYYIFSPAHNIQADVPPQNIVAAYRAAQVYGKLRS